MVEIDIFKDDGVRLIKNVGELKKLQKELKVRHDWHEPDEQDVDAVVRGVTFDNAGFGFEKHVYIKQNGKNVAKINLATLLAFACGTYKGLSDQ